MNQQISVAGKLYPCRPTMGAMLRFHRETGREVTEIRQEALSDVCTYLWCCVCSAAHADGQDFNMSLQDFADNISPEDLTAWAQLQQATTDDEEADADGEKKS